MIKKIKQILVLFLLLGQNANAEIKTYEIGVEDYISYPYQYVENGKYLGKYRLILDRFAESEGIKFEYRPYKLSKLYSQFYQGNIDFKFPDNPVWRSDEKAKYKIHYSEFLTYYIDGLFVKKSNLKKTIKELKTFGVAFDIIPWVLIQKENKEKIKILKFENCNEMISKIKTGEIDAILCNYDVMKYLLKDSVKDDEIVFNTNLPYTDNYLYLSTIKHPKLLEKFNKWIVENREFIDRETHEKY